MGVRRQGRQMAMQALYLSDTCGLPIDQALEASLPKDLPDAAADFARRLAGGASGRRDDIDKVLVKYAENWEISRMAAVDRNILRLAAYEILNDLDTPVSVVIDEAIEIAKSYSTNDSGKFVNGILDKVKKERPAQ